MSDQQQSDPDPDYKAPDYARAALYRLEALAASWASSCLWKHHDAALCESEEGARALRLEAAVFSLCSDNLAGAIRDLKQSFTPKP